MATKGKRVAQPVWTEEKMALAKKNHTYIKVGDKKGNLVLSGAARMWEKDPAMVYVPSLRVAGHASAITRLLGEDAVAHLRQAYTAASVAGALAGAYEAELAALKAHGKRSVKKAATSSVRDSVSIEQYYNMVEAAQPEPKEKKTRAKRAAKSPKKGTKSPKKGTKSPKKGTKSPKKGTKASPAPRKRKTEVDATKIGESLLKRHNELAEGKVLDVTELKVDGTGAKTVNAPTDKSRKGLVQVPGYSIVSKTKPGITKAAKFLGIDFVQSWEDARKGTKASPKAASQGASPRSSPGRVLPLVAVQSPVGTATQPMSGLPALPAVRTSPRGVNLPAVRIGSPRGGSPRV